MAALPSEASKNRKSRILPFAPTSDVINDVTDNILLHSWKVQAQAIKCRWGPTPTPTPHRRAGSGNTLSGRGSRAMIWTVITASVIAVRRDETARHWFIQFPIFPLAPTMSMEIFSVSELCPFFFLEWKEGRGGWLYLAVHWDLRITIEK